MGTRVLRTYRVEKALVEAVAAQAKARGETVTDVIERAYVAYIQRDSPAQAVYTPPAPPPPDVDESIITTIERGAPDCRHPSASVVDGTCRECGTDVWLR